MEIQMDEDVKKVIEFMSHEIEADKRISIVKALNNLALALWGHHPSKSIIPLALEEEPL